MTKHKNDIGKCPHCQRFLSIAEFIADWCETCSKPTNVKADAPKRAA